MLNTLSIENIAVIDRAEIAFTPGLNVLTGETGAGKSIVIDSLEAALGWRTSAQLIRTGEKSARVTAVFTAKGAEAWCEENGVEPEDGELILTRRITADGKSACRVNGVPVPASAVRRLGLSLIDIHGQGDGQRLTDERWHRGYLDAFGGHTAELEAYGAAWEAYDSARRELESLNLDEAEKARRLDMLSYQIAELERADLTPGEYDEKSARRALLKNAGKLSGAVRDASAALNGGERSDGALSLIEAALSSVSHAARFSDRFSAVETKLSELKFACEDAAYELQSLEEEFDFSPEELDELDDRLDALKRVLRKYGGTEEEALAFLDRCRKEQGEIEYADERREKLERRMEGLTRTLREKGAALSQKRREAGDALAARIEAELHELSMPGARFAVDLGEGAEPGPHGMDEVRFLLSANAGESLGRIAKVASGGELSRVMLAMKTVLSRLDPVDAMVFDEIDTGISGVAAQRVGEKLSVIGSERQVIAVTHLAQIAAMADTQFSIEKAVEDGRTFTRVTHLTEEGRARELARLTGGEHITETTLEAARELLHAAKEAKHGKEAQ